MQNRERNPSVLCFFAVIRLLVHFLNRDILGLDILLGQNDIFNLRRFLDL